MKPVTIILLLVIGFASGITAKMVGIGGGIIIVPAMVMRLGFTQLQAQGASLVLLLIPVGIMAVIHYYKNGLVDWRVVSTMSAAFLIGACIGSKLSLSIPEALVKKGFAALPFTPYKM